jgi:hypothetical protein
LAKPVIFIKFGFPNLVKENNYLFLKLFLYEKISYIRHT